MNVLLMSGGIISPELRHHIKPGIYSAMRKQLRLVRRAQRDGSGGETPQMSFVSRRWKDALLTLILFLFSQTAIMLSRNRIHSRWQSRALWSSYCSSVIIPNNLLLGGKSREKFSFGITQRVTTGALSRSLVSICKTERRRMIPCMSLLPFSLIKVWIWSSAFLSFYESACLRNVWCAWAVGDCLSRNPRKERNLQTHPGALHYSLC